jgi:hypothetical protein
MQANTLQIQSRARRILSELRRGISSAHIESWLKVNRLSDYLRSTHGTTITKWRESPHSILTFTPVSDDLDELQVQRSSLVKLANDGYGQADPTSVCHRSQFAMLAKHPTTAGAAYFDRVHRTVYFVMFQAPVQETPIVTVFPYDEVVEAMGELGIRLQHVRTNVAIAHRLLKVF